MHTYLLDTRILVNMIAKYDMEDRIFDIYDNNKYIHSVDITIEDLTLLEQCGVIRICVK